MAKKAVSENWKHPSLSDTTGVRVKEQLLAQLEELVGRNERPQHHRQNCLQVLHGLPTHLASQRPDQAKGNNQFHREAN